MEGFAAPSRSMATQFPVIDGMMVVGVTSCVVAVAAYFVLNFLG
jgi:hypothetical protein